MQKLIVLFTSSLLTVSATATVSTTLPRASFAHHDWELACDNTRTCRAAGYHPGAATGDFSPAASVLLTRKAGPRQPVRAQLQLGHAGDDFPTPPSSGLLSMKIDGRALGTVKVDRQTMIATLSPKQVEALVAALGRDSKIEWSKGFMFWTVSTTGAAAVLLKMDEFQGRLGTPGALLRKGNKPEDLVLPALPAPIVYVVPVPKSTAHVVPLSRFNLPKLLRQLPEPAGGEGCLGLNGSDVQPEPPEVFPLTGNKLLVSIICDLAPYNVVKGYWIINSHPPYSPKAVAADGRYYEPGKIKAYRKGRGIDDCAGTDEWTWNAEEFVHTAEGSTGMCRLVAPGGAWNLPLLVTRVRNKPGQ